MWLLLTILNALGYALQANAQSIFINNVPEYSQLATCAEQPLSVIVRSMASGCGDGSQTTSYGCFCGSSSSKMSSIISREVIKTCSGSNDDASSALQVFSSYCQIGTTAIPTIASNFSAAVSSPTPANTATLSSPSSTSTASNDGISKTSKIVIGVVVPLSVLVVAAGFVAAIFVIRTHRRRAAAAAATSTAGETTEVSTVTGPKDFLEDSSTDHASAPSLRSTNPTTPALELESPMVERMPAALPAELPTDGRYGNGTSAHELQDQSNCTLYSGNR